MTHYTHDHVREHACIRMPITTSIDEEIPEAPVNNVINQLNLGSKLVGKTSDGRSNLAMCKAILESNFDNMGVFDLKNIMFVMEFLSHVLANACKAEVIYVKYYDGRLDTEVIRINMQRCIT